MTNKFKSGDKVFLLNSDGEGDDFLTSPSVALIDISKPVKLINKDRIEGRWEVRYHSTTGCTPIGYAYEKDFKRA